MGEISSRVPQRLLNNILPWSLELKRPIERLNLMPMKNIGNLSQQID
jgi:hypothetical protein